MTQEKGFSANLHRISMEKASIEEMAVTILAAMTICDYILTEDHRYGTILVAHDRKDVYVVPPEVLQFLVNEDVIKLDGGCTSTRLQ